MKTSMLAGLLLVSAVTGGALAQKSSDGEIRANVRNFQFLAAENAIIAGKGGAVVEARGGGVLVRLDDATLDVLGGYPIHISNGVYDPRAKSLRVYGVAKVFKPRVPEQLSLGEPVDDHDEPIDLTCKRGKLQRNGIPTPKSSTCVGEGARMTCNADDSATFNFNDSTCSAFEDPAG